MWDFILNTITEYLDRTCPVKDIRFKDYNHPWFNNDILELINDRSKALRCYRQTGQDYSWENAKRLRDRITRCIKEAKSERVINDLLKHKDDVKVKGRIILNL